LVFPTTNAFAENQYDNSIDKLVDKLVDANGKYKQRSSNYAQSEFALLRAWSLTQIIKHKKTAHRIKAVWCLKDNVII
jgi:hypothetical protein